MNTPSITLDEKDSHWLDGLNYKAATAERVRQSFVDYLYHKHGINNGQMMLDLTKRAFVEKESAENKEADELEALAYLRQVGKARDPKETA